MAVEITGNGGIRLEWDGSRVDEIARQGAARGLGLGAEHVRGVSVDRAPLDTAALRNSATASVDAESLTAAVSYDTPYAARQHEELDYHHRTGGPKYLESALASERDVVARLVQAQIRKALGS
ncbi:hypothetical protein [Actinokineospora iranica]|uniref:Phage protein, HK97 gp10 family n=1 Tax=Actinokineospora iranica TaxID=1271860 RepID=A0A1G6Y8H0_9PSEU|nr:hypothetical protein [Actinokineospora iranica]SDD86650.1 hypothetical protein SAMN05216174_12085 [Actinokineospora iranica]